MMILQRLHHTSVQWRFSPTFSNSSAQAARLRARSSRPRQQNNRTNGFRRLGVTPSKGLSLKVDGEDGGGLSGIVALAKMRESRRRCRSSRKLCADDTFSVDEVDRSEY